MRPGILFFLFSVFQTSSIHAQTLNGKIIDGLGEEGLPNVRVEVSGFATAFSDQELGTFSLSLPGLRPGTKIPLDIAMEGYAVINREATHPRLPDNPLDRVKVHLAPEHQRDKLALKFYKITVERNIQVNFDTAAKRFAEEANYAAIAKLHADYESALKMADSLAARLSRFDPQSSSDELTQAMQLYQEGKVEEALNVLDAEKIIKRIEARKQIVARMKQANQQDISSLIKAADMALTELRFDKAQEYYEAAVMADTMNLGNLMTLCAYLEEQNQSQKLIQFASLMKNVSGGNDWYRSMSMHYLGRGLHAQNQGADAIIAFQEALEIRRQLVEKNPSRFKTDLALTLTSIGLACDALSRYDEALSFLEEALDIRREFSKENSQHFEADLATILINLGNTYQDLNRYDDAISFYEEALVIRRRLSKKNPQHFEPGLVVALNAVGNAYADLNRYVDAISTIEESLTIIRRLSKENPQRFVPDVASSLNNLGNINNNLNRYDDAIAVFKEALNIRRQLAKENPQRYQPDIALTLLNLGNTYSIMKRFEDAVTLYEEALAIQRPLLKENPERFEPEIIRTLNNLGTCLDDLDRHDEAIARYSEALEVQRRLAKQYPQRFELDLTQTLNNLGVVYFELNRRSESIAFYKEAIEIQRRLAAKNPNRFKKDLGRTLANLGLVHGDANAIDLFKESLEIYKQLAKENPKAYEPSVALILTNLGVVYRNLNRLAEEFAVYVEALEIQKRLAKENPQAELYVAMVLINLSTLTRSKLLKHPTPELLQEGKKWMSAADSSLHRCPDVPYVQFMKEFVIPFRHFYQTVDLKELSLILPSRALRDSLSQTDSLPVKISFQQQIIDIYESALAQYPEGPSLPDSLTKSLNVLSGWQVYIQDHSGAGKSVLACLEIDASYQPIHRWEAVSLLLQGKFKAAKKVYETWADTSWSGKQHETFREVFLADFVELEATGITHPDMDKIRTLLTE
ncbi:MAG: tetratricopeptide repeat protein [Bacteroidota bacterium]